MRMRNNGLSPPHLPIRLAKSCNHNPFTYFRVNSTDAAFRDDEREDEQNGLIKAIRFLFPMSDLSVLII